MAGNRLIDTRGHSALIRGADLPLFSKRNWSAPLQYPDPFGPFSATTFSGIRRRWNMNAVRLTAFAPDFKDSPNAWHQLSKTIRSANSFELLVILAAESDSGTPEFWTHCAQLFKDSPNVVFDIASSQDQAPLAAAIRATGALQPIVAINQIETPGVIYEVHPRFPAVRTSEDREKLFGPLLDEAPILATNWDLPLDSPIDCAAIPNDPTAAEALVEANLDYFDQHNISWISPAFMPGVMLHNNLSQDATSLEYGWTCGSASGAGIGEVVRFHLWTGGMRGLFAVNGGGGIALPRGGVAILYGPIFAFTDSQAPWSLAPATLGGVSVKVTDHFGVSRAAGMIYASQGWGQANVVIPAATATGPVRLTVMRQDGSVIGASATVVDAEPCFWSAYGTSMGPAIAKVTQTSADGKISTFDAYHCAAYTCSALPIPLSANVTTTVRLLATGFRHAGTNPFVRMTIGGIPAKVVSIKPGDHPADDEVTVQLPPEMRGRGEVDLVCHLNHRVSNVVRINLGAAK